MQTCLAALMSQFTSKCDDVMGTKMLKHVFHYIPTNTIYGQLSSVLTHRGTTDESPDSQESSNLTLSSLKKNKLE